MKKEVGGLFGLAVKACDKLNTTSARDTVSGIGPLTEQYELGEITRREFNKRLAFLGLAAAASTFIAGCASSGDERAPLPKGKERVPGPLEVLPPVYSDDGLELVGAVTLVDIAEDYETSHKLVGSVSGLMAENGSVRPLDPEVTFDQIADTETELALRMVAHAKRVEALEGLHPQWVNNSNMEAAAFYDFCGLLITTEALAVYEQAQGNLEMASRLQDYLHWLVSRRVLQSNEINYLAVFQDHPEFTSAGEEGFPDPFGVLTTPTQTNLPCGAAVSPGDVAYNATDPNAPFGHYRCDTTKSGAKAWHGPYLAQEQAQGLIDVPGCLAGPVLRMINRDQSLAESPRAIAGLAERMIEKHEHILDLVRAYNMSESLMYFVYVTNRGASSEQMANLDQGQIANPGQSENFQAWRQAAIARFVQQKGGLESAYQQYLKNSGLSPEDLAKDLFETDILPDLVAGDFIARKLLKTGFREGQVAEEVIIAMVKTGLARLMPDASEFMQQIDFADPRFQASLKVKLASYGILAAEGAQTGKLTLYEALDQLGQITRQLTPEMVDQYGQEIGEQIYDSLYYHPEIAGIKLVSKKLAKGGVYELKIESGGSAKFVYRTHDGKKIETEGVIISQSSQQIVDLTKPDGHYPKDWCFRPGQPLGDEDKKERGEEVNFITGPEGKQLIKDFQVDLVTLSLNEPSGTRKHTIRLHQRPMATDVFKRIELRGKRRDDGSIQPVYGVVAESSGVMGEVKERFYERGTVGVESMATDSPGFDERYLPIHLRTGKFYGPGLQSLEQIMEVFFSGNAVWLDNGMLVSLPTESLQRALALTQAGAKPRHIFWAAMPERDRFDNRASEEVVCQDPVPVDVIFNPGKGKGSWISLRPSFWRAGEKETDWLNPGEMTLLHTGHYGGILGKRTFPVVTREGTKNYYIVSVTGRKDEPLPEQAKIWQKILRRASTLFRGKEFTVAAAVPADQVELVELQGLFGRLIGSGVPQDVIGLTAYLSAFPLLGELAGCTDATMIAAEILYGALKSGVPVDWASYLIARNFARKSQTTR